MPSPKVSTKDARRYLSRKKRGVAQAGDDAQKHVERHFINRLQNLAHSWRFVLSWLVLSGLLVWVLAIQTRALDSYYTQVVPRDGGTYTEGILGPLTNMNPIYANTPADLAASRLMFSGLMKYNTDNILVPDLARDISSDDKASVFTVTLRDNLRWHDGAQISAEDVVYTVKTIQDPGARSPLRRSLEGVSVEAIDDRTVSFTLPGSFSPFPNILTFGILPSHLLEQYSPAQLRSVQFNSSMPVGSGPFKFQRIVNISGIDRSEREQTVQLTAFNDYHFGKPRLGSFTLHVAPDQERLTELFNEGELSGAVNLLQGEINGEGLSAQEVSFSSTSGVFLFFRTTDDTLKDPALRRALTKAVDIGSALSALDAPVQRLRGPLLSEQVAYTNKNSQFDFDRKQAAADLEKLGWKLGEDGIRKKGEQRLSFSITTQADNQNYANVLESLQKSFLEVGVEITADYRASDTFAETILVDHVYEDMLLYGINIGVDPDVYSFWHSSQADRNSTVRLNLSEYKSDVADEALEGGRSRVEPEVRADKYQTFTEAWRSDAPAVGLYRPRFVYYQLKDIGGPMGQVIRSPVERLRDVHQWTVLTEKVVQ